MVLPYPRRSLLLLKADGPGRARAVDVMQSAMLRLLTAMPPSKVRFTIVDPVGLGDSFSAFMHLADYDQQLVASRIWTDTAHIEQRLADLTKHMEDVLQVYLRKEFHSIEEYNAFAGEMAEPYRVLVVADFPANFSETAADRLKSIVASGAQCGVFVLMSVDEKRPLPRNFHLADLEQDALVLPWTEPELEADALMLPGTEGGFVWEHPDFGPLVVNVPPPPAPDEFKEILHVVGTRRKTVGRVEVSFSCVVPDAKEWWTADSRSGLDVPLGRAGAMKLQHLDLGGGTSQHVLISGKTGSGKSTLLARAGDESGPAYSPDEVELYLVDFKKGVEFKAYARAELPHARVVAIESEREFGLSVLQRLDAELRTRGDLFRGHGVQDVKGLPHGRARGQAAADTVDHRRVPGAVRGRRPHRPGGGIAVGPAGSAGPGVRHSRVVGLADSRRGLHAGPQHDRPDGRAHRLAVQRGRRPPDSQRRQHGGPAAHPARRGDLQRRQRPVRGQSSVPGRVAPRQRARRLSAAAFASSPSKRHCMRRRRRSCSKATFWPTSRSNPLLKQVAGGPVVAGKNAGRAGLARLGGGHQGPHRGHIRSAERQQPADGGTPRGGRAGRDRRPAS